MSSDHSLLPSSLSSVTTQPIGLQADNFTHNMWGGSWIAAWKGLAAPIRPVGESWEFSAHPKHPSLVSCPDGSLHTLIELLRAFPKNMVGARTLKKDQFPFLLKFIDSREDLSVQVHPSDEQAERMEEDAGKSEAWYILDVEEAKDAGFIYLGFDPKKVKQYGSAMEFEEAFLAAIQQANSYGPQVKPKEREKAMRLVLPFLNRLKVVPGEAYRVPPGTIHAIGRGVRLFEIQETSDITYRIWDWNRPDAEMQKDGKLEFRPLHLDKAKQVLDYQPHGPDYYRISRRPVDAQGKGAIEEEIIISEDEHRFTANLLSLRDKGAEISVETKQHFCVLTCVEGSAGVHFAYQANGAMEKWGRLLRGRSVLIPAAVARVVLTSETSSTQIIKSY